MGRVIRMDQAVSARDGRFLAELLGAAQLVLAFSRYARADLMGSPDDQARVAERLHEIGEAARKISRKTRAAHPDVPWTQLEAAASLTEGGRWRTDPEKLWTLTKKIVPRAVAALEPLAPRDDPARVFMVQPAVSAKPKRAVPKRPARKGAARRSSR